MCAWNFVCASEVSVLCAGCGQLRAQRGWEGAFGRLQPRGRIYRHYLFSTPIFWSARPESLPVSGEPVTLLGAFDGRRGPNGDLRGREPVLSNLPEPSQCSQFGSGVRAFLPLLAGRCKPLARRARRNGSRGRGFGRWLAKKGKGARLPPL